MSASTKALSTKTTTTNQASLKPHEAKEVEALNSRLKHISDKCIGPSPFLLTIPNCRNYHHSSVSANDWRKGLGNLFGPHEENLQYLSFINNWDDTVITPVGGWDNDKGEMASSQTHTVRSTTTTPKVKAKKISLSDYHKRAGSNGGGKSTNGPLGGNSNVKGATSVLQDIVKSIETNKDEPRKR
jgi:hypothetical protein